VLEESSQGYWWLPEPHAFRTENRAAPLQHPLQELNLKGFAAIIDEAIDRGEAIGSHSPSFRSCQPASIATVPGPSQQESHPMNSLTRILGFAIFATAVAGAIYGGIFYNEYLKAQAELKALEGPPEKMPEGRPVLPGLGGGGGGGGPGAGGDGGGRRGRPEESKEAEGETEASKPEETKEPTEEAQTKESTEPPTAEEPEAKDPTNADTATETPADPPAESAKEGDGSGN
jgi:hypothetical protein